MTAWPFADAPTLVAELDEALTCLHTSRGWRERLGLAQPPEAPAMPLGALLALDEPPGLEHRLRNEVLRDGQAIENTPVSLRGTARLTRGLLSAWRAAPDAGSPRLVLSVTCSEDLDTALGELRQLRTRHELILNAVGDGIYGFDRAGGLTFGNAASMDILGWDPEHLIGKIAHDVHHHSHADGSPYPREDCPIYAALRDGAVHRVDHEVFWHTDGSAVPVEYISTPIVQDGAIQGAVVVFRDVTERRAIEQQREAAYREIGRLKEQLELERDYLREEIKINLDFGEIIGTSEALRQTLAQIAAVAPTPASVLVLGESGVGKEMIARAIHARSERADKPLVKVNCASIPAELFESEFFGHVKGAFTGAHRDRVGRLQLADGGTLFLDEVGEIPLSLQSKLLRALQERELERVGDDRTIQVDVRVVAATNRDLDAEIKAGRFREDLFYRLSVFPILVPPLRERPEDVAPLAQHFLERACAELGREGLRLSQQQAEALQRHDWPGNIRELKNVIERAVILGTAGRARLDLAMPGDAGTTVDPPPTEPGPEGPGGHAGFVTDAEIRAREKANMLAALRHAGWKVWGNDGAAQLLGLKPSTLAYKMKALGLRKEI
jgi:PAS domain S-box-containing protein